MAVAAFLLHRRIGDGNHPVRAALLLLVVAGDAGDALFIVEAGDVLLELLVVDLGENGLGFFGSPLLGRDRVLAEGLDELVVALEVELDGSLRCEGRGGGQGDDAERDGLRRGFHLEFHFNSSWFYNGLRIHHGADVLLFGKEFGVAVLEVLVRVQEDGSNRTRCKSNVLLF